MAKLSILIGFSYKNFNLVENYERLPGVIIDLFLSYTMAKNMNSDRIVIFTDIDDKEDLKEDEKEDLKEIKTPEIYKFIKNIINDNIYSYYGNIDYFLEYIVDIVSNYNEIFLYYTGHGSYEIDKIGKIHKFFIFPQNIYSVQNEYSNICNNIYKVEENYVKLYIDNLISLITKKIDKNANILIVTDCCNCGDILLRYKLEKNIFRLTKNIYQNKYIIQNVLYIASTLEYEESVTSKNGSIFSSCFFKCIDNNIRNLNTISKIISRECKLYNQTISIYSSYPNNLYLQDWLFPDYKIKEKEYGIIEYTFNK